MNHAGCWQAAAAWSQQYGCFQYISVNGGCWSMITWSKKSNTMLLNDDTEKSDVICCDIHSHPPHWAAVQHRTYYMQHTGFSTMDRDITGRSVNRQQSVTRPCSCCCCRCHCRCHCHCRQEKELHITVNVASQRAKLVKTRRLHEERDFYFY